ncbi:MAG: hypothetical protein ACRBF0_24575 [Calditrichia bacterium]
MAKIALTNGDTYKALINRYLTIKARHNSMYFFSQGYSTTLKNNKIGIRFEYNHNRERMKAEIRLL